MKPEADRPSVSDSVYQDRLESALGKELAAISQLPLPERFQAIERIRNLQGESPRDRAWPTEGGHEPAPEPGWDATGSYRPEIVRQVYLELVAAGKLAAITVD